MLLPLLRPSLGLRAAAAAASAAASATSPLHLPTASLKISISTSISTSTSRTALRRPTPISSSFSFSTSARTQTQTQARTRLPAHALSLPRRVRPRGSHPLLFTTLALSSGLLAPQLFSQQYLTRNDSAEFSSGGGTAYSHGRDAKTPLSTDGGRSLNPAAVRQISMGAVLGLGLGVAFSALSRMLVLVLGVGIVVWQYAARKGYNFIPVDRMQRYVKGVNLRSAINDNAAFKISFGLMFALTAFGEF